MKNLETPGKPGELAGMFTIRFSGMQMMITRKSIRLWRCLRGIAIHGRIKHLSGILFFFKESTRG